MSKLSSATDKLGADARQYLEAEVDNLKLRATRGLSKSLSSIAGILLALIVASACVLVLSFALVLLLGEVLGSYSYAAFIIAGALLLISVILFLLRNILFKNSFVRMFIDVFFPKEEEFDEPQNKPSGK